MKRIVKVGQFSMEDAIMALEEFQSALEVAIEEASNLQGLVRGTIIARQMEAYTIPWLNNWINDTNQPGSIVNLRKQIEERGGEDYEED